MRLRKHFLLTVAPVLIAALLAAVGPAHAQKENAPEVKIDADDIGGIVTGAKGPEAGVWVIAETNDLPTKYAKIVVTDDKGRFVIPDLPKANYDVWVRGYGLVDSAKVKSAPGKRLALRAKAAPDAAAAEYYPGMYWYSLLSIPDQKEFPGTGDKGNGISEAMKAQRHWIDSVKNSCQSCHALGSKGIRSVPKQFGSGVQAWAKRTQSGQALLNMALTLGNMGSQRALKEFADWTDRIAKGELPFAKPARPQGVERNVVITIWDWATPKIYLHDAISTDRNNPTSNANGRVYGAPEESTDAIPVLDPVRHVADLIPHPYRDMNAPSQIVSSRGESAYWGNEAIWDGHTSIHNPMMDKDGRLWFTARIRPIGANPAYCKQGSDHPSARVAPQDSSLRQLSMYDPKSGKWSLIDTCFPTHHLYFAPNDPNYTLWTSAGGPNSGVVGWLNTKMYLETGDEAKSQGWTPIIVDANGNGRRDAWVEADAPLDPAKDKRIMAAFYGVMPSPVDDAIWGQAMDVGFSRLNQPGYLIRLVPGPNPAETALSEIYQPPEGTFGPRGLDIDSKGLVWTTLASGHIASFDRSKCKGPLNGPQAVTGTHCPEGWQLYRMTGPQFKGLNDAGSANHAYYLWVDRFNTFGLGKDVPIASTNGSESLMAVVNGKIVDIRVPYPLGFFTKNVDGRIDDANAGWKGRGLWTTSGTRTNFHNEGGNRNRPKVYKLQLRPDPLAG
jgi:hypothetical protein